MKQSNIELLKPLCKLCQNVISLNVKEKNDNELTTVKTKQRDCALDNYRGFVILLLIFFFSFNALDFTPAVFTHASDGGILAFADFITAGFMLALVLAFAIGMEKFVGTGDYKGAIKKYSTRFLALIGVGMLFVAVSNLAGGDTGFHYNVFTAFGISGLLSLFFIRFGKYTKLIAGCILIITYQCLLLVPEVLDYILANDEGGLIGGFGWCGFMLIAIFLAQLYRSNSKQFTRWIFALLSFAMVLATADMIMKSTGNVFDPLMASAHRVSLSYIFITLGVQAFIFWLFAKFAGNKPIPVLTWYGRNSLVLYFVSAGLGNIAPRLCNTFVTETNIWYVMPLSFIICFILATAVAYTLHRFKVVITV